MPHSYSRANPDVSLEDDALSDFISETDPITGESQWFITEVEKIKIELGDFLYQSALYVGLVGTLMFVFLQL